MRIFATCFIAIVSSMFSGVVSAQSLTETVTFLLHGEPPSDVLDSGGVSVTGVSDGSYSVHDYMGRTLKGEFNNCVVTEQETELKRFNLRQKLDLQNVSKISIEFKEGPVTLQGPYDIVFFVAFEGSDGMYCEAGNSLSDKPVYSCKRTYGVQYRWKTRRQVEKIEQIARINNAFAYMREKFCKGRAF